MSADPGLLPLLGRRGMVTRWRAALIRQQFVRDYLESIRWNKQEPAPTLPDEVVERTQAKYLEAFRV